MKETIYTIPINEAYEIDCECPLCELHKRLEAEAVEYAMGPAMMEPDFRINSNEKGFCNRHFTAMFSHDKKLPLALMLDTHLDDVRKKLSELDTDSRTTPKKSLFKKNKDDFVKPFSEFGHKLLSGCVVCEKANYTMERYSRTLLFMWAKDDEFKETFEKSKGVCMLHFDMLVKNVREELKDKDAKEFIHALVRKQESELARIQEDIHKFTLKFDYRNRDMELGTAKDSPRRTIEKLSGYMDE